MTDNQYIYAVARIRSKELSLLSKQDFEQLLSCKDYKECMNLLFEKGWGSKEQEDSADIISYEHKKTWDLIQDLVEDMSVFDVFLYENDFHNLKAAIKQAYQKVVVPNIFISHGTVLPSLIREAIVQHDFSILPERMRECGKEAYEALLHTGDGQLCDMIVDKGALDAIYKAGKSSNNELLSLYAELKVAVANIKIAIRGCNTNKNKEFYIRAMTECETLNIEALIDAAIQNVDAVMEYLNTTVYNDASAAIKQSLSAFERWCDNMLIAKILPQKYNPFTVSPVAAYILARDNELKTVRIILSGKRNSLSEDIIRERIRDSYV